MHTPSWKQIPGGVFHGYNIGDWFQKTSLIGFFEVKKDQSPILALSLT